jgi:hypothetical protein
VNGYGTIALKVPVGIQAVAMLSARSQDLGPHLPDELLATIVGPSRTFIVSMPAQHVASIPACDRIWKKYQDKSAGLDQSGSGVDNGKAADQAIQNREEGDKAYRACFAKNLANAPFAAHIADDLETLIGRLPLQ